MKGAIERHTVLPAPSRPIIITENSSFLLHISMDSMCGEIN